ncbi:MAG: DsbA family oxidoreductase, partial [Chloroflexi bacterium]
MERLKQTHSVQIIWHSFELRPAGSPPISPEYMARIESLRPQMEKMARD